MVALAAGDQKSKALAATAMTLGMGNKPNPPPENTFSARGEQLYSSDYCYHLCLCLGGLWSDDSERICPREGISYNQVQGK